MRTTLDIDGRLLKEAMARSKARTKTQAVEQGLRELINAARRYRLIEAKGQGYGMTLKSFLKSRSDE
jgi:Arc/MetJ family transcription regulator